MRRRGSILIGLLWCVALLSVVVIGVLHTARLDLLVVKNYGDRIQAHYLALAGIEKAKALLYQNARDRTRIDKNHTDELYNEIALGSGNAPIHCVDLLAHWHVKEAVPRFLRILEEEDFETIVYSRALFALKDMGAAILDDILSFANSADPAIYLDIGSILSEIGRGDPRAYAWIKARFDEQVDEFDIRIWAESLLEVGGEDAIAILEDRILKQKRKFSRDLREVIKGYIQHAREYGHP